MIRLNVFLQTSQNKAAVVTTAKELAKESAKETGCLGYELFESCTNPDLLMICETWKDEEALETHRQSTHFKRLSPQLHEMAQMKTDKLIL